MTLSLLHILGHGAPSLLWNDTRPVRQELFGVERLEQHAESLATAQSVTLRPPPILSLHKRLKDNASALLRAYQASAAEMEGDRGVVPAAEWLLDNYHLVEEHIREIHDDLPPGFYRQLPKLAEGPFAGYPRIFGIAWAYVAHTDSHFDPEILRRFVAAYQRVQPLTIGELWALAISLRIVLIENLRRLADQITAGRSTRATADELANRLLISGRANSALEADIATRSTGPLSELFAAQLAKRLRDQDPRTMPALGWLEERLRLQGTTIEEAVQQAQQRQGASNVTVRNVITSMRLISDVDWPDLFESMSLVEARLREAPGYAAMDFPTRNLYRSAIEQLARGTSFSELEIADKAVIAAHTAAETTTDPSETERISDPGYHLIDGGRLELERTIGFRPPPQLRISRFNIGLGISGYVGAILLLTLLLMGAAFWQLPLSRINPGLLALLALAAFIPVSDVASTVINRAIAWSFNATPLPALEMTGGVPSHLRTLIAMPTLLTSEADLLEQIERLEVHHLAGAGGEMTFALLSDGLDADQEVMEGDARLLSVATDAILELNRRHGPGPCGDRFLLLHRRRLFNAGEDKWMGWERKRGKLHELNQLLRGATNTSFLGTPWVPADVRYVITLDADTRLPRDTALKLIGKMAHPLNRPKFCPIAQRVTRGYGILQPRVTPALPVGTEGSLYQRVFSSPGGMDPYASASSDVYQDMFGEGSYTGKGIYDIDAFESALSARVPDNALLSHDLFEGTFARAGLASDVEVVDEFPARYDVAAKRQHRWSRGDWQLAPWIFGQWSGLKAVPPVGRWKMLDNLRRSLLAPLTLAALALSWFLPGRDAYWGSLLIFATIAIPTILPMLFTVLPHNANVRLRNHLSTLGNDFRMAVLQPLLLLAFLPDHAWRMGDAIVRTLLRLFVTHHHLLEWTTAAQSAGGPRPDLKASYQQMLWSLSLPLALFAIAMVLAPASWPLAAPITLLWFSAPFLAWRSSCPPTPARLLELSKSETDALRLIARRTWRYFETFVTAADNMLPPDNFQEDPRPIIAHRTSPTNIGLYLLSVVAARDFGWSGLMETAERLEATLVTMAKMTKFKGHLFNWYDTNDLHVLDPQYISSVDSGNLAGHLITLANACDEWQSPSSTAPDNRQGLFDDLLLAREALAALHGAGGDSGQQLASLLDEIDTELHGPQSLNASLPPLKRMTEKAVRAAQGITSRIGTDPAAGTLFWVEALRRLVSELSRDLTLQPTPADVLKTRLTILAAKAREMAGAMDFAFLIDPDRKLLSIGYCTAENSLDSNCYDLLASEARLASLFAIAKGDVATKHWFRLGRAATPLGNGSALISWSGSMFEYLMPSLVMRAPFGSLLEQTNRLVVERQQAYGRSLGVPWGISESAYNARDLEFTYQYSNFGVPGLGLKRGLSENVVTAPYATGLAAMIDPQGALRNYAHFTKMGARGSYGFYEAVDFTRVRLPEDEDQAIVLNYMAHHQGMTIVSLLNTLQEGRMRARFHREPMIQACELLLQERIPRNVAIAHPRAEEVAASATEALVGTATFRRLTPSINEAPVTHLLSNGRYTVMLTATGAGFSRWRDIAVTRWREDVTRDDWGSFIFLRDTRSDQVWSVGAQPFGSQSDHSEVIFDEDHAEFIRRDASLTTSLDVLVSGESNGEVRRVTLTNGGRHDREIELTSYAEVVLTTPAADGAHPAFSKMFVETEHLAEFGALIASRRPRAQNEAQIWAAHFAVVEGEISASPQYETDRARFLGRGHSIATATAIAERRPLSNTVGTVLDPIFSLRRRIKVPSGKMVRLSFWTVVASSRAELLDIIDTHHERNAFDRAKTLAWTQAQVQLHHLNIEAEEAADFQRLTAPILYSDPRYRVPSALILGGAGPQSGLWEHAISGDLPIVLLRIDDIEDIALVRQLLRARDYWRMKHLAVDLVIINEHSSSYRQNLQEAIETAVRSSRSRRHSDQEQTQGSVYSLRADLMSVEARALIQSVARIVLIARHGMISNQLSILPSVVVWPPLPFRFPKSASQPAPSLPPRPELEFFNGLGGFDKNGREYVTYLDGGRTTPAPWINVIANPGFGFQVSCDGSGYSWAENSRENQITPWSNDPVSDPIGEVFYIRDETTGDLWSPTSQPIRNQGPYLARHGFGYSSFEHQAHGIASKLLHYVPLADPIKISRLTLHNQLGRSRRLSITAYVDWVLGTSRGASAPFIITKIGSATGALLASNPWSTHFPNRVAFADLCGRQSSWTADRTEFLGRMGSLEAPAALLRGLPLSKTTGAGHDPCGALQSIVDLAPGETVEITFLLGQTQSEREAQALITRYREIDLDAVLEEVTDHWTKRLGTIQVQTPDRSMDIMLNGWLLYQTLACRIWARSAFYQASGAYGFRDQLQDGMSLSFAMPEETRRHLLRAAGRQFVEGDVQHWWLPQTGRGVRTHISDDRVWLAFATESYISTSGDSAILDEVIPFLDGPPLPAGEHDAFFEPMTSATSASLFEHCARGIDQCIALTGAHGLPLIGGGDWNDGFSRVGAEGKGESVWLGWLLMRTIALFGPFAEIRDPGRLQRWNAHAALLRTTLENDCWDGEWYRRATYDNGLWLGSKDSDECQIDAITQSWAVLSGANPTRAAQGMASMESHLIRRSESLALLFTPPFDKTPNDPGYIKGYPPGLRENGGQYSHAAMWSILAYAKMGQGAKACGLFDLLNPINHSLTPYEANRYKVEPYVVAADVYSVPPLVGRGGWTWYTGAAGWMYQAGIEGILGMRRSGASLSLSPCIPASWPGFKTTIRLGDTHYEIQIDQGSEQFGRPWHGVLDGTIAISAPILVPLDGKSHSLLISNREDALPKI